MLTPLMLVTAFLVGQAENSSVVVVQAVALTAVDDLRLGFEEAGKLSQVLVTLGDDLEKGQLLAAQVSISAKLEVERIRAKVQIARFATENNLDLLLKKKTLGLAENELERALESVKQYPESVSRTEVERLRFAVEEARIRIQQAEFTRKTKQLELELAETELAIAEEKLSRRQLQSPIAGQVVEIQKRVGEWTQPAEEFVRIIRTDRLRAEGFIEGHIADVTVGQPVELSVRDLRGQEKTYTGLVTFVDPEINPITSQYRIHAEIKNPERTLRPGQQSMMRILTGTNPMTVSKDNDE